MVCERAAGLKGLGSLPNTSASTSSSRMLGQWPALSKQGISQTLFTLGACALRPPHYHLRATGLLYLINGTIQVGFTNEDGTKAYVNNISAGASTVFPQGLVHYQQNLACEPAQYTISYNSEDPGTQVSVPGLVGLPNEVVAAAMGFASNANGFSSFLATVPTGKFIANSDPECVARCSAAATPSNAGK
ncbi:hypothetical protein WJX73_000683 [Symbiochloris irregularis]|uniref:Germin-like protein n=1 Tax=Symbiochloris irregularis TaxID=706552 RepID=A0AAW1NVU1_9CHLO